MDLYRIDEKDTVAVAIKPLRQGESYALGEKTVTVLQDIPAGHKVALKDMKKGERIIKYGAPIGEAAEDIPVGEWIHTHNVISHADDQREFTYDFDRENVIMPGSSHLTFRGYKRKSGEVGTRNYIVIMSGVFCSNSHIKKIAAMAEQRFPKTEHFDGFLPLTHECGCGQAGQDIVNVKKILAGLLQNPNFGGILFMEVGCEITKLDTVMPYMEKELDMERFKTFTMQEEDDEIELAMEYLEALYQRVNQDRREECPVSGLHIATNCGGSDGFSGLTGNKLVGSMAERICAAGGTVTLTEITEMFGAEQFLMNKAIDEATFEKIKELIRRHKAYIEKYGESANGNPSFGNKQGGITTIEDKSLGCVQKSGRNAIVDVVFYGDRVQKKGLNLVQGPGSDLVGVTSQIVAGANMVVFSTGRGTPVAFAAPTLKVATNHRIFEKKQGWMDFSAGSLIDGKDLGELTDEFVELVLRTASGEYRSSNERTGFYEIGILRDGVIL
ncbi:MAG: altronate dehydratase [Firmicutes bacterium]|nr:altronate dehydratase [Bacillota bacterium]